MAGDALVADVPYDGRLAGGATEDNKALLRARYAEDFEVGGYTG